jgi:hypothetical protein
MVKIINLFFFLKVHRLTGRQFICDALILYFPNDEEHETIVADRKEKIRIRTEEAIAAGTKPPPAYIKSVGTIFHYPLSKVLDGLEADVTVELTISKRNHDQQLLIKGEEDFGHQTAKIICRVERAIEQRNREAAVDKMRRWLTCVSSQHQDLPNMVGKILVDSFPEHVYKDWSHPNR